MNDLDDNLGQGVLYVSGTRGYSAYEIAVQNGFVGTEDEWLDSLVGPQGEPGTPFDELTEEQKEEIKGDTGKSAYDISVEHGFIGTEQDWVNSFLTPDGYVKKQDIIDNLQSSETQKPLSANQGRELTKYIGDKSNPIYYGADPTGTTDSANAINQCIQANKGGTINFTIGTYLVNNTINLPYLEEEKVSINGNGATIKTSATLDRLIYVGFDKGNNSSNNVGYTSYIKDLNLDGKNGNVTYAIENTAGFKDLRILNCRIFRFINGILIGGTTGNPADVLVSDSLIYGKGSEYNGAGIICNCTDNNINMCRVYGFRKGFVINGYTIITKCHVLLRWENQTTGNFNPYPVNEEEFNTYYEQTMFAEVNNGCRILHSYCDSTYIFAYITTTSSVTIDTSFYFNARANVNMHLFEITQTAPKINLINNTLSLRKNDDCQVIVNKHSTGLFNNEAQFNITDNILEGISNLTSHGDLILSNIKGYHNNVSLTADTWYLVKIISNFTSGTITSGSLFIGGWKYEIRCVDNTNIYQLNKNNTATRYTVGIILKDNKLYVCVKSSETTAGMKIDFLLENLTNLGYAVTPVNGDDIHTSTRLLSDYIEETPTVELQLNQAIY